MKGKPGGGAPKHRGVCKAPEHPDSVEHARKCAYAVRLYYIYKNTWSEVAATLWPIGEDGEPVEGAKPMWNSGVAACQSTKRYQRRIVDDVRDDLLGFVVANSMQRQAAMAGAIERGDLFTIQQHRAEDEFLVKVFGAGAPKKIAMTTPDGSAAMPVVAAVGLGLSGILQAAKQHEQEKQQESGEAVGSETTGEQSDAGDA